MANSTEAEFKSHLQFDEMDRVFDCNYYRKIVIFDGSIVADDDIESVSSYQAILINRDYRLIKSRERKSDYLSYFRCNFFYSARMQFPLCDVANSANCSCYFSYFCRLARDVNQSGRIFLKECRQRTAIQSHPRAKKR